jgi:hypothetical protein
LRVKDFAALSLGKVRNEQAHAQQPPLNRLYVAGHGVAARRLGVDIRDVDMTGDGKHLGNVWTRSATWVAKRAGADRAALARGLYTDLLVTLAGQSAQKLAGYPEGDFRAEGDFGEGTADIDNAILYAWDLARIEAGLPIEPAADEPRELHPGDPLHTAGLAIIERAEKEIYALLQDSWQAVVRVAGVLGKRDRLTQEELDHIIAHGQRGRQK